MTANQTFSMYIGYITIAFYISFALYVFVEMFKNFPHYEHKLSFVVSTFTALLIAIFWPIVAGRSVWQAFTRPTK